MTTNTVAHSTAVQLRAIAAWLDSHPEFEPYDIGLGWEAPIVRQYGLDAEIMAEIARTVGGRWTKDVGGASDELFKLRQEIVPGVFVELIGSRENVCKRVVTGTREIEVTEPDPDAVAALPKVTRTVTVEDAHWDCGPILSRPEA